MPVTLRGLSHSFPGTGVLFRGLDLDLRAGDLVALTGPSGSGKSTLLSLIARWERPAAGTVTWAGVTSVGWVFQNSHGVARRTALDHVTLPLLARGAGRADADRHALAIMERFGLAAVASRPFAALSGGEAQRLMLARAVAKAPSLLLVDEPTAQLGPTAAATVNRVLGELAMAETIVVVATHDADTRDACSRVVDLRRVPA
ncbi:ABC transporter ATP-binding protein [Xylanimonas protaetiae]|uniref:ATP-binding cassette domain-containing protein n=1 Tax=Xylanimonas protaetiae TaxID=2509457 RepID=A0A4V0YGK1_9MICO|nr:ATP-binding cassette domain-containing protein [Xylanimonas protaetiae]QAY71491.1 ATP-binding cassette domain-containing protein [Xylanimonas protaetiae]